VTRPAADTLATPGADELQLMVRFVRSKPAASVTAAESCSDWPAGTDAPGADTVTVATAAAPEGPVPVESPAFPPPHDAHAMATSQMANRRTTTTLRGDGIKTVMPAQRRRCVPHDAATASARPRAGLALSASDSNV
jgi:hypothetical protein